MICCWAVRCTTSICVCPGPRWRGEDITFVCLTRGLLSQEIFDTAGRPWLRSGYDAALFSPRDIYRTGEEAPFKAVVRNSDITTPKAFPVLFVARDPLGRKVRQETVLCPLRQKYTTAPLRT